MRALILIVALYAPGLRQQQLQPLDLQAAHGDFALRQSELLALRKDHRMRGGKIVGKRFEVRRHGAIQPQPRQQVATVPTAESIGHSY